MSANCDYVYVEGLRFETGTVEVLFPIVLVPHDPPAGPPADVGRWEKPRRLEKSTGKDAGGETVSVRSLKDLVPKGHSVRVRVMGRDGTALSYFVLDPRRCEGRSGRRSFVEEDLTGRRFPGIRVAREQLRTLPYGRIELRGAKKRLEWAVKSLPDGEAGLMALTGDAPHLAGALASGVGIDQLKNRPHDTALLRAALPWLASSLDLSAKESADLERRLAAMEEERPKALRSKLTTFEGSVYNGPFSEVADPSLLRRLIELSASPQLAPTNGEDRENLVLGALDRLGDLVHITTKDRSTRIGSLTMHQQAHRNQQYHTFFATSDAKRVGDLILEEMTGAIESVRSPEILTRALSLRWAGPVVREILGEERVAELSKQGATGKQG